MYIKFISSMGYGIAYKLQNGSSFARPDRHAVSMPDGRFSHGFHERQIRREAIAGHHFAVDAATPPAPAALPVLRTRLERVDVGADLAVGADSDFRKRGHSGAGSMDFQAASIKGQRVSAGPGRRR